MAPENSIEDSSLPIRSSSLKLGNRPRIVKTDELTLKKATASRYIPGKVGEEKLEEDMADSGDQDVPEVNVEEAEDDDDDVDDDDGDEVEEADDNDNSSSSSSSSSSKEDWQFNYPTDEKQQLVWLKALTRAWSQDTGRSLSADLAKVEHL